MTHCWPVLVGPSTPIGSGYVLIQRITNDPGYGGDVLQFHESATEVWAIHRVWTLRPEEKRRERIKSPDPKQRHITQGCINVDPFVYDYLVTNYQGATLDIVP